MGSSRSFISQYGAKRGPCGQQRASGIHRVRYRGPCGRRGPPPRKTVGAPSVVSRGGFGAALSGQERRTGQNCLIFIGLCGGRGLSGATTAGRARGRRAASPGDADAEATVVRKRLDRPARGEEVLDAREGRQGPEKECAVAGDAGDPRDGHRRTAEAEGQEAGVARGSAALDQVAGSAGLATRAGRGRGGGRGGNERPERPERPEGGGGGSGECERPRERDETGAVGPGAFVGRKSDSGGEGVGGRAGA